jgi:flagellar hook-length control protein FliK
MTSSSQQSGAPFIVAPPTQATSSDQASSDSNDTPHPSAIAEPAQGFSSSPMPDPVQTPSPLVTNSSTTSQDDSASDAPIAAATMPPADPEHLAGMKQQALDHLEPLVGHLEQSPEESFKTTMMMIQANDNHTLLEKALEQAKKIEDDKVRANAMLDIINEINYFSQVNQTN